MSKIRSTPPIVEVVHHAAVEPVEPVEPDEVRVSVSVGPCGELVALWSAAADLDALHGKTIGPGGAVFPDSRTSRPVAVRVTAHWPDPVQLTRVGGLTTTFPTAHPLPDGAVLVVGSRARHTDDGGERNAIAYDPDGQVRASATLGDGIEHVFTTRGGDVWVGYFDEGVYGNFGWGEDAAPMGAAGLVRFGPDLQPAWHFPYDTAWDAISDCYALNVTDDAVWSCYYTGFPVVRIQDGQVSGWHNEIAGAHALVVAGQQVGLFGGYDARDRLAVGVIDGDLVRITGRYRVALPGGSPLPAGAQTIGRGHELHVITAGDWYCLDLTEAPARARN